MLETYMNTYIYIQKERKDEKRTGMDSLVSKSLKLTQINWMEKISQPGVPEKHFPYEREETRKNI